ncbi:YbaB/EbfC family nucleoid-associated protein [Candidatus Dojkabacteria bacterium]|uniref:YbaB/EbfC family nucleoid-associated protein n=1 Tax=Candidatus Dojkabacteria bacterium TaxID=2099670 RepID=A0A955L8U7_9BACT|nr:YbaB/EbfC family nucleoid-associated protein [Candidatus Dojkabacteria bacterium]
MALGQLGDMYKLQKEARKMQKELKSKKVTGLSKNEDVEVVIDGTQEVLEIGISDAYMTIDKKNDLTKALKQALKDAQKKLQKEMTKSMDIDSIRNMIGG